MKTHKTWACLNNFKNNSDDRANVDPVDGHR